MRDSIIDDVMRDIRLCEENADAVIEQAKQQSKDAVLAAQAQADAMRAENKQKLKEIRNQSRLDVEKRVRDRREALMKKGEAAAKELIDNKNSAVEVEADNIVETLVQSYK